MLSLVEGFETIPLTCLAPPTASLNAGVHLHPPPSPRPAGVRSPFNPTCRTGVAAAAQNASKLTNWLKSTPEKRAKRMNRTPDQYQQWSRRSSSAVSERTMACFVVFSSFRVDDNEEHRLCRRKKSYHRHATLTLRLTLLSCTFLQSNHRLRVR